MTQPTAQRKSRKSAPTLTQIDAARDAASLLYADYEANPEPGKRLTDQIVAEKVGVSRATVTRWKRDPDFIAMIEGAKNDIRSEALKLPTAQVHKRVELRDSIVQDILHGIRLQGERMALKADSAEESARRVFGSFTPPEAATGWYVERTKIAASGKTVTDYELDTGAIKAINDLMEAQAKDLGQRTEKHEHAGPGGTALTVILTEREDGPR